MTLTPSNDYLYSTPDRPNLFTDRYASIISMGAEILVSPASSLNGVTRGRPIPCNRRYQYNTGINTRNPAHYEYPNNLQYHRENIEAFQNYFNRRLTEVEGLMREYRQATAKVRRYQHDIESWVKILEKNL